MDRLREDGFLKGSMKEERVEGVKDEITSLIRAVENESNQKPIDIYVGVEMLGLLEKGR